MKGSISYLPEEQELAEREAELFAVVLMAMKAAG